MAERRMFAKTIIDSDAFLDMPLSTQALYFHLSMRADDDGFINNPRKIQRMIGASDDDLKMLVVKRFIIPFESGIVVIKHWKIHNYIRGDRKKPSVYPEEMALLAEKDNGAYTLKDDDNDLTDKCPSTDGQLTDKCQHRLGKDRIGKDRLGEGSIVEVLPPCPTLDEIRDYISQHNLNVNAEKFFRYYDNNGWKTVKGTDVKWQDKLHEWSESENKKGSKPKGSSNPFADIANSL